MTHSQKIKLMISDLHQRRVGRWTAAPPIYRLLWRLGSKVRPPLFQSFIDLFLGMGTYFGVLSGLFIWLFSWRSAESSGGAGVVVAVVAGALFGLFMAIYYHYKADMLGLPDWESYPEP